MNSIVQYFRARETLISRFVGGWGVYGGLVVSPAPGIPSALMSDHGPIVEAGLTVQVSAGVAIDALGRPMPVCAPAIVDIAALIAQTPTTFQTRTCSEWFSNFPGGSPCESPEAEITAQQYWLVIEYEESPFRPVPQYSGGGACDPAPSCDFSRTQEGYRFRLVTSLPPTYQFYGCLTGALPSAGDPPTDLPREELLVARFAFFEKVNRLLAETCCATPAVVLGQLLVVTQQPLDEDPLPTVPRYLILDPGYPNRRPVLAGAILTYLSGLTVLAETAP